MKWEKYDDNMVAQEFPTEKVIHSLSSMRNKVRCSVETDARGTFWFYGNMCDEKLIVSMMVCETYISVSFHYGIDEGRQYSEYFFTDVYISNEQIQSFKIEQNRILIKYHDSHKKTNRVEMILHKK